ncbi:MAG: hypothetical protein ABIF77_03225, partial [bacterium]
MRLTVLTGLLLLSCTLVGCVQIQSDTVIEDDGSGTFTMTYAVATEVMEAMTEMAELEMPGQDRPDAPTLDDFDKAEIERACKENNVKLTQFERKTEGDMERLTMKLEFERVEDVSRTMAGPMAETTGVQLYKTSDGNYTLRTVDLDIPAPDEEAEASVPEEMPDMSEMDMEAMGKSMEIMGKLMARAQELSVVF